MVIDGLSQAVSPEDGKSRHFPLSLEGQAKGAWSGSYPEVALKEARSRCVVSAN
ncbi:hypothetical protein CSB92_5091 [Pseudomonas aeruginosa]|nr:hypothetical protein CSC30_6117 [Pseudomonas aeruginosa]AWF66456.1 hypothetical protein CSC27_1819 [Pseudomonas aeruginosa]AZP59856.1 DUF4102 containing protein [Pseudomonas aeruginosa]PRW17455.1 hypothetical protein CSB92_5091 [Pseudomonas aeruginosa]QJE78777.1 DUF4102 domain-containing protein [Pseudomonas aeruginosa]